MTLVVPLLVACAAPADGTVYQYTLHLRPVVPENESPFEGLSALDLVVQPEVGDSVRAPLELFARGATSVTTGLPPLDGAVIHVEGFDGSELVTWGRSEPILAESGEVESTVLVARTSAPAWLGGLAVPAFGAGLAPLGDGAFLLGGGLTEAGDGTLDRAVSELSLLRLVPATDSLAFEPLGSLPGWVDEEGETVAERAGATLLPVTAGPSAGRILLVGGAAGPAWSDGVGLTGDTQLFDFEAAAWTPLAGGDGLAIPRAEHLAIANAQGGVVVAGGWTRGAGGSVEVADTIEVWDASAGRFGQEQDGAGLGNLDLVGVDLGADGTMVCGGAQVEDGGRWVTSRSCVAVGLDGVARTAPDLPAAVAGAAMVALPDGRILLTGGATQDSRVDLDVEPGPAGRTNAWVFVGGSTWQAVSPMGLPRAGHRLAVLPDGRVLVAGGAATYSPVVVPDDAYSCIELFDPLTNRFELVGDCDVGDAAGGLAGRAWKPAIAVDPELGALVVGGANASATGETAASQVTLFVPERQP